MISRRTSRSPAEVVVRSGSRSASASAKRRIRRVGLGERDDLGGLELASRSRSTSRADRDRSGDLLRVAAAHLEPVEPVVDLVGRQTGARAPSKPEAPGRDVEPVSRVERDEPLEQAAGLLVRGECGWIARTTPSSASRRIEAPGVALLEQRDELVASRAEDRSPTRPISTRAGEPLRVSSIRKP